MTLHLDTPKVDKRTVAVDKCVVLKLPLPPSTNHLFINVSRGGRVISPKYREWRKVAADHLWLNPRGRFTTPVKVCLTVTNKSRSDLDNHYKAVSDFIVMHGFIPDDSRKFVREITLKWGDVAGCEVQIERAA